MRKIIVSLLVLGLLAGAGYGIYTWNENRVQANKEAAARAEERAEERAEKKAAEEERKAAEEAIAMCRREVGPFIESLSDLDAQLDIGMNHGDYSDAVREAAVEQNRVDENELDGACLEAFDEGERALDLYSALVSEWEDCIWSDSCDPDYSIDFSPWNTASDHIAEAEDLMRGGAQSNL